MTLFKQSYHSKLITCLLFSEMSIKWLDLACILSVNDLSFNLWNLSISTDLYLSYFSSSLLLTFISFHYNNQLSTITTILSNHIPSTLYHIYTLFSLKFIIIIINIIKNQLWYQPSNSSISFKQIFNQRYVFFYLCYLCSRVSVCVLTILYITAIFQVIYLSIIMTNILNQDLASYMW